MNLFVGSQVYLLGFILTRLDFVTVKILQLHIRDAEVSVCVKTTAAGAASEGGAEGEGPEGSPEEERLTGGDRGGESETPTDSQGL